MKRWYAVILLASFLTGMLQPVLPMVEYHLFTGDLRDVAKAETPFCTTSPCELSGGTVQPGDICRCERPAGTDNPDLLDTDYYPIPVQTTGESSQLLLSDRGTLESIYLNRLPELYLFRDYPPPRTITG